MRLALLAETRQGLFNLLRVVSPIGDDLRVLVVTNYQQLVAFVNLVSELARGGFQLFYVRANGQRVVNQQDYARGRRVWRKVLDGLLYAAVVERQLFARNRPDGIVRARGNDIERDSALLVRRT